jgi:hypothetical protein
MFRSSATIPRLYRIKFKRDIFKDLSRLEKILKIKEEVFEINKLEIFSIDEIMPVYLELWGASRETDVQSKK